MKTKICCLLYLLPLLLLCFIGCGKKPEMVGEGTALEETMEAIDQFSWSYSRIALSDCYESATMKDNKICGYCYNKDGIKIVVRDVADGSEESYYIADVTLVQKLTLDSQGRILVLGNRDEETILWKLSGDGTIECIENIDIEDMGPLARLKEFLTDSKGYSYLWYRMTVPSAESGIYMDVDRIYVKDQKMQTVRFEQMECSDYSGVSCIYLDEDENPTILAADAAEYYTLRISVEEGKTYQRRDVNSMELYGQMLGERTAYCQGKVLHIRGEILYLFHLEDGREEKLLELAGGGITEQDILYMGMQGDTIAIIDQYFGHETSEYTCFRPGKGSQTEVTLGISFLQDSIRQAVRDFNRSQDQIRILPVVYAQDYDFDMARDRMRMDLVQGKAPDLLLADDLNYDIYAQAGAYLDLYDMMDRDPEFGRESFVPSVLKAYEMDGHVYAIAHDFALCSLWGPARIVKGRSEITMAELRNLLQENGGDVNSVYGFSADESILTSLCHYSLGEFVNWKHKACDFTGAEFIGALEFAGEYRGKGYDSLCQAFRGGDLLLTLGRIYSVESYCMESKLYGEEIQFLGYPGMEGSGTLISMGNLLAINAKSPHSDEAWEFLKFYLLHGREYDDTSFPVLQEQFDQVLEASLEEWTGVEEDGRTVIIPKKTFYDQQGINLEVYKAEPEDVEAVRNLVENASGRWYYCNEIQKIIDEEAQAYYQHQKTAQQVAEIIQNRVQLYLDENE